MPSKQSELFETVMRHLPTLREQGVALVEVGGVRVEFGPPLTATPNAVKVESKGQLALSYASAAPAAQLEAPPIPDATAGQPAKPATDDAPDDLDLGHLG